MTNGGSHILNTSDALMAVWRSVIPAFAASHLTRDPGDVPIESVKRCTALTGAAWCSLGRAKHMLAITAPHIVATPATRITYMVLGLRVVSSCRVKQYAGEPLFGASIYMAAMARAALAGG